MITPGRMAATLGIQGGDRRSTHDSPAGFPEVDRQQTLLSLVPSTRGVVITRAVPFLCVETNCISEAGALTAAHCFFSLSQWGCASLIVSLRLAGMETLPAVGMAKDA